MKKSACIEMIFTEVDFYDRFKLAHEAGFKYIEFWGWEDKDLAKIKALCEEYDLEIASFSGDKDYSLIAKEDSEKYIDYVIESINAAKLLNCKHLVIHSNALGEGGVVVNHYTERSDYELFGAMIKTLMELQPIAEDADVTLVLEALNTETDHVGNFLAFTEDAATAIQIINSPRIKILYDLYHMQLMEGKMINTLEQFIGEIGYIHIADAPGRREPGTGEVNFPNVWRKLKELNYEGFIGFELEPSKQSEVVAKELVEAF
ncbi:TIM barrel protein [Vallitalea okinawensis]|uniref:TIM barrel protein n=1 Tax=Vallitalea okinawensis TaxID=2078660 RepID=UPI000CFCFED5|nr:TIM barrel protein [Vallitalea okinawensis]